MEKPLTIFIVGTTAVGKTKLSIELCKILGGQVVNCDSKQLYKYASIMTAKASNQEQAGVHHHMLSVLELEEACYNRNKYFEEAWKVVEDIKSRGKVPVIIGGTNYYLQTLLYQIGASKTEQIDQEEEEKMVQKYQLKGQNVQNMSGPQKYQLLKKVDPLMAQKLHPNDQVRVQSFLQRYLETGKPPSAQYKPYTHKLRDANSILLWLQNSDKNELHGMMGSRVDKMIEEDGLLQILSVFQYAKNHNCLQNMGALQSIGYKQFKEVFEQVQSILGVPQQMKSYDDIAEIIRSKLGEVRLKIDQIEGISIHSGKNVPLMTRCKEILTKNTIDYSKRQLTWIKNRLFAYQQNRKHFFTLDIAGPNATINQRFNSQILQKSMQIIDKIRNQGFGTIKQDQKYFKIGKHQSIKQWKKYRCQQCQVQLNGKHEWEQHLKSRRHRGKLSKKDRKKEIQMQRMKRQEKNKQQQQQKDIKEKNEEKDKELETNKKIEMEKQKQQ